jgi:hypothetical protein
MICRQPKPSGGAFDQVTYRHEFGFAFAGSTLTALSTHALANILCGNLGGMPNTPPPTLEEIANAVATISFQYTKDIGQAAGLSSVFSGILFGHCPRTGQSLAFQIQPSVGEAGIRIAIIKHILDENNVIVIGDQPQLFRDEIEKLRANSTHEINFADAPMNALREMIRQNAIGSVGGSIQQAWAISSRLEIVATAGSITPSPPSPRNYGLFVLGFDTFDMQQIGNYKVTLMGR